MKHKYTEQELPNFLVGIRCMTYNHHDYIVDAMNGFTMQQTMFPFVAVIVDDASTDGEPEVISNYVNEHFDQSPSSLFRQWENDEAKYIFAQHKDNKNCYFGIVFLKTNYYSQKKSKESHISQWLSDVKYIALCEGDDYWIDPLKLQMQANYMECHKDYSLCGTNGLVLWDFGEYEPHYFNRTFESRELQAEDIIGTWALPTASLFYRREIKENYPSWTKEIYSGDQSLILISLYRGRIFYFKETTCVYRKSSLNTTSLSNKTGNMYMCEQHIKLYTFYNEWSGYKYSTIIEKHIGELKDSIHREKRFAEYSSLRKKSWFQPYLKMPMYALKMLKHFCAIKWNQLVCVNI